MSVCDLKEVPDPAVESSEEESPDTSKPARPLREVIRELITPNILGALRRAGRLSVDRELTLKILELRLEQIHSRDGAWPERLVADFSSVCPGAVYIYRTDGKEMRIRFDGEIPDPSTGLVLPLEFRTRPSSLTPAPTPAPALTPAPSGGMIGSMNASRSTNAKNAWWWQEAAR
jgi:hypothetical protein